MKAPTFTDQCGNLIAISESPQRIISLVPSQTELLFDLGLEERIIGITRYCVHPTHWKTSKSMVGGTKNFDFDRIADLKPDLIIGNKEENYLEGIRKLRDLYPVWLSDILTLEHAIEMIVSLGAITGTSSVASGIIRKIRGQFETIRKVKAKNRVLYFIWRKPWMAAGKETFINSMLEAIGLDNCLPSGSRYPELTIENIRKLDPELILLSSEPYPFRPKHLDELKRNNPLAKILLVDGEMFSWYGSRLQKSPGYFNSLPLDRS